jgi:LL-diaminopimelate aminotransferase
LNKIYSRRRSLVVELLETLDCKAGENQVGMFIWAQIPVGYADCYTFSDEVLYNSAVFITPGGIFGQAGEKYIRVSLCSTEEKIREAITRVQKITA